MPARRPLTNPVAASRIGGAINAANELPRIVPSGSASGSIGAAPPKSDKDAGAAPSARNAAGTHQRAARRRLCPTYGPSPTIVGPGMRQVARDRVVLHQIVTAHPFSAIRWNRSAVAVIERGAALAFLLKTMMREPWGSKLSASESPETSGCSIVPVSGSQSLDVRRPTTELRARTSRRTLLVLARKYASASISRRWTKPIAGCGGSSATSAGSVSAIRLPQIGTGSSLNHLLRPGAVLTKPAARSVRHVVHSGHDDQPVNRAPALRSTTRRRSDRTHVQNPESQARWRQPDRECCSRDSGDGRRRPDHRPRIVCRRVERDVGGRFPLAQHEAHALQIA